jgi:RHS repeat-associated protein
VAGGVTTFYHYDREGELLSESDANGNPVCDYIYLGKMLVGKMVQPVSSGIYYYHVDPVGMPLAMTDNKHNVVWTGFYEPFGNEYNTQGTISNDIRFAGNKKDSETGLNYFSARYLDVTLGRFMASDPVGPVDSNTGKISSTVLSAPQRLNAYAYAGNNPVSFADPFGLSLASVPDDLLPPRRTFMQSLNFALTEALFFVAGEMMLPLPIEEPTIRISRGEYPQTSQHILDAQEAGYPRKLTIDRAGAKANRAAATESYQKVPGKHLDEYPPAMFKEGGSGASVSPVDPSDNMGAGASMGNQLRNYPDGTEIIIEVGP